MEIKERIKKLAEIRAMLEEAIGPPKTHMEWAERFNMAGRIFRKFFINN